MDNSRTKQAINSGSHQKPRELTRLDGIRIIFVDFNPISTNPAKFQPKKIIWVSTLWLQPVKFQPG
jgi:hypothetical protein